MDATLYILKEQIQGDIPLTALHLRGWLNAQSEETLLAEARIAYDEGARYLLLDLAEVDTLTSAGMRAMHKVYKLFTPQEERLKALRVKMCNAPQQVYDVLGITGFLHNIPNYETLREAVESFKK